MFHWTPKWAGRKYASIGRFYTETWETSTPCGTAAWEATIGKGGNVCFSLISLGIQKAKSKKEVTCSQKYRWPQVLSPKWFWFTLRNWRERNHPHVKPCHFHWNWDSQFLLPSHFSLKLSFPPSYFFLFHERIEETKTTIKQQPQPHGNSEYQLIVKTRSLLLLSLHIS